ncbi:K+-dependent Na+/Ca+ exchanger-like protein [Thermonema lapsum]|uniref:K+-dependent Na+/Ca+ exchanger-like protein n=1 Tax=Thermonema lapsum TaxID=28195 RepID=A0A846MNC1_9BACT|nr:calcium/sodium antiporter [Thermonema lapsum]NIK72857.1 K+-dependent Na+/Ca+ exchanger-like protein [Thermonema lapsum]
MEILRDVAIILFSFYFMSEIVDVLFIKSLDNIAARLKLSESVSGATLLAFGTSAPEIATALFALFLAEAHPATGVGTIVGSAIFQILVVIGFACIANRSKLSWKPILRDSAFYAFSVILLLVFVQDNKLTLLEGAILVGCYILYLTFLNLWMRYIDNESKAAENESYIKEEYAIEDVLPRRGLLRKTIDIVTAPLRLLIRIIPDPAKSSQWTYPVFILCLGFIALASYWMVMAAERLALQIGIPTEIIALTILAGGTSMPEIISSYIVAKQGRGDMAIANAIGSNIFDILMSLGLPVLIYTLMHGDISGIGSANITSSVILLFASLLLVLLAFVLTRFHATRLLGYTLIVIYVVYVWGAYAGWLEV